MKVEYKHIYDIEKFKNDVKNFDTETVWDFIEKVDNDNTCNDEDKKNIKKILNDIVFNVVTKEENDENTINVHDTEQIDESKDIQDIDNAEPIDESKDIQDIDNAEQNKNFEKINEIKKKISEVEEILNNTTDENVIDAYIQYKFALEEDLENIQKKYSSNDNSLHEINDMDNLKEYILKNFTTENETENETENLINNEDDIINWKAQKLKIKFNSSAREYSYEVDGRDIKGKTSAKVFSISKKQCKKDVKKLLGDNYGKTEYKSILKYVDTQIYSLIKNNLGENVCKQYLNILSGKNNEEMLPVSIQYDLKGLNKNKEISFFDKINLKRIANRHEKMKIAEIEKDKISISKITKKIAAIFGAGLLLTAGGSTIANNVDSRDKVNSENQISDTVEPTNESTKLNITDKEIFLNRIAIPDNNEKDTQKITETSKKKNNNVLEIKLGTAVKLPDGIKYAENSLGTGRKGTIGNNVYRQAGEYTIDGYSIIKESKDGQMGEILEFKYGVDDEFDLGNYIAQNDSKDVKIKLHISQGTEINEDGVGAHPTGWTDAEKIIEEISKQQKETQNINSQDDHEAR